MFNQNKKYGYIVQNNRFSPKNKSAMNEPQINLADKILQNLNLLNQTKKINNQNKNENNLILDNNENHSNDNAEYFDSDIDDPKYKPSYLLYNNVNKDMSEKKRI